MIQLGGVSEIWLGFVVVVQNKYVSWLHKETHIVEIAIQLHYAHVFVHVTVPNIVHMRMLHINANICNIIMS